MAAVTPTSTNTRLRYATGGVVSPNPNKTYRPQLPARTMTLSGTQTAAPASTPAVDPRSRQTAARSLPRDDLRRSLPFQVTRAAATGDNGDGLTMEGTAAVFNTPAIIDSWEGRFKEQLAPGSFRKTLREKTPKLQFDHGTHPLIGSLPIGRITSIGEEADGVRVEARLSDNWLVQPVREAISNGTIDGMSFRFSVIREEWVDENGKKMTPEQVFERLFMGDGDYNAADDELMTRTIKELACAELGPVVFPAYTETSVGVRSITIDLGQLDRPGERTKLARAIIAADQAETPESEVGPAAPPVLDDRHPGTTTEAAAPPANAEHPASDTPDETRGTTDPRLARMDAVMARIHERSQQ
jgi:HK97 family phage prohead protease